MQTLEINQLDAWLHSTAFGLLKKTSVVGACISFVKSQPHISLTRTFGYSNLETAEPVDPQRTYFQLGANTKLVTALCMLQLQQERKLSILDNVNLHLPDNLKVPDSKFGAVTLHHLLSHTSGLDLQPANDGGGSPTGAAGGGLGSRRTTGGGGAELTRSISFGSLDSLGCVLAFFRGQKLVPVSPAGMRHKIQDCDYMLLGAIVERLSGLPFHLYLQQQLLPGFGITLPDEAPVVAHVLDAHHWPSLAVSMVRAQDITPLTGLALSPQGITSLLSVLVSAPVEGDDTGPPTPLSETDDEAPLCDQPPPAEKAAAAAVLPPPAPSRNGNKAKEPPAPPLTRFPKEAVEMLTCKGNAPYAFSYSRQDPAGYVYLCLLDDHSYVLGPDAKGVSGPHGASSSGSGSTPPSSGRRRHANHGAIAATDGSKASNTLLLLMPYSGCALCIATNTNSPTALEMLAGAGAERFWGGSVWQGLAAAAVVSEPSAFAHHIALQIASRWPPLQMLSSEAALWLSPILRPPDPAAFIFCFPSIGSSASDACYNWPICGERLSLADVTAFELPGHGARAREPPCGTLETVVLRAAGLIAATTSHISHISLYGHGLGGLMAFETARCLHALYGRHVCHIFVSGCASPTCWGAEFGPGGPPGSRLSGAASAAGGGGGSVSSSLEMVPDDEELVAQLAAWPRTPPQMQDNKLLLRGALKALRAELSYEQAYVYSPPASSATPPAAKPKPPHPGGGKHHHSQQQQQQQQQSSEPAQPSGLKAAACLLPCGITVSFGTDDPTLTAAQLDQWRAVTSGPLTLRPFTGGHFFMRQGNNMVGMLDSMSRALITQLGPTGSCRRQQHAQSHHDPN